MRTNAGNRTIEDHKFAAANSQDIKDLANRRSVPIIAAVQMNRSAEADTALTPKTLFKRLQLSDLSQSGSLEQDADLVYFMRGNRDSTVRSYHLAKNRNGPVGHPWYVSFRPDAGTYHEITSTRASTTLTAELDA
jgi:replicative DNA helicase